MIHALATIGKRMLSEALPKYCGNPDKIVVFDDLLGVRYKDPKMYCLKAWVYSFLPKTPPQKVLYR